RFQWQADSCRRDLWLGRFTRPRGSHTPAAPFLYPSPRLFPWLGERFVQPAADYRAASFYQLGVLLPCLTLVQIGGLVGERRIGGQRAEPLQPLARKGRD